VSGKSKQNVVFTIYLNCKNFTSGAIVDMDYYLWTTSSSLLK
jgi:hypothetical protein